MRCDYACGTAEHAVSRRAFMGSVAAVGVGAAAVGGGSPWLLPAVAEQLKSKQKRVLTIFLHGGVSQLETWDPKPNTDTGGPFRPISTSVPGLQISELLPYTAKQMHRLSVVRSINTKNGNHNVGEYQMTRGHNQQGSAQLPHLGAVVSKALTPNTFSLPGHILIRGGGSGQSPAAYLGPRYGSVVLEDAKAPAFSALPAALTPSIDERRQAFRRQADERFSDKRRTADTDAYTYSYDQAVRLMAQRDVFDVTKEPAKELERYGSHEFGRHCLLARRLLEQDVPFVQVNHSNYDTHFENFDYHIEQLGEFDKPFSTLIGDLADRGLLEDTLVVVMSEFGRTPKINSRYGRDHWGTAWSVCLGGAGIQPGAVIGKTNANGTLVTDREVDHGHLFHTYLQAVGVDSASDFVIAGRSFPVADPAKGPISELLA
ncbi:MAG: DUF1501 domain-containing protein [Planctomycetia bacterium]|nr:DUF1501 domain-containing protein [Planctomycetia bacterium]